MKVNRVTETRRIPDRDARSRNDGDRYAFFRIDPLLESSGNTDAEPIEHVPDSSQRSALLQPPQQFCHEITNSSSSAPEDTLLRVVSTADSLQEFLARVKNAYRLNLQF